MKKAMIRTFSVSLVGAMTLGTCVVSASPTAGFGSYREFIATAATNPTAGFSSTMTNYLAGSAETEMLAGVSVDIEGNDENIMVSASAEMVDTSINNTEQIEEADITEYTYMAVCTITDGESLNVRASADAESEVVGKLYYHNVATVIETEGDWYKIRSGNVVGYVYNTYMTVGDEDLVKSVCRRTAYVTADMLRVRSSASTEADILGRVPQGEDLTVVDESIDGWVCVEIEEGNGYVSKDWVSIQDVYTYGETSEEIATREAEEEAARQAAAAAAEKAAADKKAKQEAAAAAAAASSYDYVGTGAGADVVSYALQFVGNPYVYGGTSLTSGADCSGFVMSVYAHFGVSLPHSSRDDRYVGYAVSTSEMQPGDIVCYSGHVAIYIGNGQIVHAASVGQGITVGNVYYSTILAVRRIY